MKSIVTLDFETYYDSDYTLKKMTTEAYIRDPRFKAHGVGVLVDGDARWITDNIKEELDALELHTRPVLCHHAHFDGLILSEHYGIHPLVFLDTLSMGRALGVPKLTLGEMAQRYAVGMKNPAALEDTAGKLDLSPAELDALGEYCCNDVRITKFVFDAIRGGFPISEIRIIDSVVKMFTRPLLHLDRDMATATSMAEGARIDALLLETGVERSEMFSNPKFSELLMAEGVDPPKKTSLKTGKETFAFAKTDAAFTALLSHPNERVAALVAARLGTKSSILRTRADAMAEIAHRTAKSKQKVTGWPVYLRYSGARQTHRLSGADKVNPQNLTRGSLLRKTIHAPPGHVVVACDSSNIELRVNMTLAGQTDVVEALRQGRDLYCEFASLKFGRPVTKADKYERQFGKVCQLALGYSMAGEKFKETARLQAKLVVELEEAHETVALYRKTYPKIVEFWRRAAKATEAMQFGQTMMIDPQGLCVTGREMIIKPSGLPILYSNIRERDNPDVNSPFRTEDVFDGYDEETGRPQTKKIYGGKIVENIVQSIARDIICEQMLVIADRYPVALQVHDEIVCVVPKKQADECMEFMIKAMSTSPAWFPEVPLAAEADWSYRYGDCK